MPDVVNRYTITNPAVSVIMPCYNAAETVDETLHSLVRQTYSDFEVLAIDDGSTDTTLQILYTWSKRDSRIHVLERPHAGVIEASNVGLSECNASLVARMDADDISHPDRFSKQIEFLDQNPEIALVGCLVEGFPPEDVRQGFQIYLNWLNDLVAPESIEREIYIESPLAHPSIMLRKFWIDDVGEYQEHGWPEDYDLLLRLNLAGAKFAKVPEVLHFWREHPRRLTRTDSRYSVENFLRAKAHYLCRDLIKGRDSVIIWGAGQMGRRISKHLLREGAPLVAFIDVDPKKIGRERRGRPIYAAEDLPDLWAGLEAPILLAAVGARGARKLIREQLSRLGFLEGEDWWAVA